MLGIRLSHGFIYGTAPFFAPPCFASNRRRKFFNRAANRQPACKYGSHGSFNKKPSARDGLCTCDRCLRHLFLLAWPGLRLSGITFALSPALLRSASFRLAGRPCFFRRSLNASSASSWNDFIFSEASNRSSCQVSS
jgi:hypothetical protein